jgi:DNA replication protein DnaC
MSLHLNQLLSKLNLNGALFALQEQIEQPGYSNMSFEDRLSLILEREILYKDNRKISRLIKEAKLRYSTASIEEICYQSKRGLDKAKLKSLQGCQFIVHRHNLLITGPTGCGKTYIACALGHQACRMGFKVKYLHLPRFMEELTIAHVDGSFPKTMMRLQQYDVLILDDFGLTGMNSSQRQDLFNLIEDRYQLKSTIITSQLPVSKWHECIGEPTIADAILDRVLENTHRIEMDGESMRKKKSTEKID